MFCFGQSYGQDTTGIINMIKGHDIDYPEIVFSQMMLETGNLKCTNCSLDKNNFFGFLKCTKRDSLGVCVSWRYLVYDNLEHCLEGYKAWQEWRCPECETKEEYYSCLFKYWGANNMKKYIYTIKQIK